MLSVSPRHVLILVDFTEYPSWVNTAVLFVVGILVPLLVNDFLDGRESYDKYDLIHTFCLKRYVSEPY